VFAGRTTLGQLAALFEHCALVLGGDSGPLHLAAAVGTPTVRVYGPTSQAIFGPWGDPAAQVGIQARLPCEPCDNFGAPPCGAIETPACLRVVASDEVVAAALRALRVDGRVAPLSLPNAPIPRTLTDRDNRPGASRAGNDGRPAAPC
jgi:heptosyltransferase-2/heptosyltransferase-3